MRVGTRLLFSIWGFSTHFAWGLTTANPYAVRALEKATRRRCLTRDVNKYRRQLLALADSHVPYITHKTPVVATKNNCRINTAFFVDHSTLAEKLSRAIASAPWELGPLQEGWEWLAFTFRDQDQLSLTQQEIEAMLLASDQVTRHAYSRMVLTESQKWTRHYVKEARQILEFCGLVRGNLVFDFGCGTGRHVLELASAGLSVTGVDYIPEFIEKGRISAQQRSLDGAHFVVGDCRSVDLDPKADAIICVYDVVGTYADDSENTRLMENVARQVKRGGRVLVSVMNGELTERRAEHWFSLRGEPDKLLQLTASRTMEQTGDVFNPAYYMIDRDTGVVYRKEQFAAGTKLPAELIVRDRRFFKEEIEAMCAAVGLTVLWSRFVRAGAWEIPLSSDDDRAKEILLLCELR